MNDETQKGKYNTIFSAYPRQMGQRGEGLILESGFGLGIGVRTHASAVVEI